MPTTTTYYTLYMPALGDGALNGRPWGIQVSANFASIDAALHAHDVAIASLTSGIGGGGVPAFSTADNGRILSIASGAMVWVQVPYVSHSSKHLPGGTDPLPWSDIIGRGPTTSRPPASSDNAGYLWFDTTTQTLTRSSGTAWEDVEGSGGAGASVVYSTSETPTNEINRGKTVYAKIVTFGALPGAYVTKSVAHGITGLDRIVRLSGMATDGVNWLPLGYPAYSSIATSLYASATSVNVAAYSDMTSYTSADITIWYTKTS